MTKPPCSLPDCDRPHLARGLCRLHYYRLRNTGTTDAPTRPEKAPKTCTVPGCSNPYRSGGYCGMHYQRARATGSPGPDERLLTEAGRTCSSPDCETPAKTRGLCEKHARRARRLEAVQTDPSARMVTWATDRERLERIGWVEVLVRPDLGPCWEWRGDRDRRGYGRVSVQGRKMRFAHRIAFREYVSDPAGLLVCHRCDNPPCVRPDHLFLGSQLDNMGDAAAKGRSARGESQGGHILTEDEVRSIRARYAPHKVTARMLAADYGVSPGTIRAVVSGRSWRHLLEG